MEPIHVAGFAFDAGGRPVLRRQTPPQAPGLIDLARVNGIRDGANTAFARTMFRAARAGIAEVQLGFSDRAAVYLNGRLLYRGDDGFQSRGYRFLGSIGYFDRLYLPLVAGDNELIVAGSEDFVGRGVQARFPDASALDWDRT